MDGGEKSHKLTLDVVSDIVSTSLAISGELVQKPSMVWKGVLERVTLSTEQGPWRLEKPVAITADIDKQFADVAAHCWLQADFKCLSDRRYSSR